MPYSTIFNFLRSHRHIKTVILTLQLQNVSQQFQIQAKIPLRFHLNKINFPHITNFNNSLQHLFVITQNNNIISPNKSYFLLKKFLPLGTEVHTAQNVLFTTERLCNIMQGLYNLARRQNPTPKPDSSLPQFTHAIGQEGSSHSITQCRMLTSIPKLYHETKGD